MPNRILITGSGMVACALAHFAPRYGHTVFVLGHDQLDITDRNAVRSAFKEFHPDTVLHTAALTLVDYCEENPAEAVLVNQEGTQHVVGAAEQLMARLIYFSSDYVFDGTGDRPWLENEYPNPINVYGMSKCGGEQIARAYHRGSIVRTSGIFGPRYDGKPERNFVRAITERLYSDADNIPVVADQFTAITYAGHLASMVFSLLSEGLPDIVHMTSSGKDSWYGWARRIAELLDMDSGRLSPVSSEEYNRRVPRPGYSVLGSQYRSVTAMVSMHSAENGLKDYITWITQHGGVGANRQA